MEMLGKWSGEDNTYKKIIIVNCCHSDVDVIYMPATFNLT